MCSGGDRLGALALTSFRAGSSCRGPTEGPSGGPGGAHSTMLSPWSGRRSRALRVAPAFPAPNLPDVTAGAAWLARPRRDWRKARHSLRGRAIGCWSWWGGFFVEWFAPSRRPAGAEVVRLVVPNRPYAGTGAARAPAGRAAGRRGSPGALGNVDRGPWRRSPRLRGFVRNPGRIALLPVGRRHPRSARPG